MVLKPIYFLFILISLGISAQELPPIQNHTPIDYSAGNQNWSIDQANNKYIYVANNSGLLEFNGALWKLYQSPFGTPVKSVKVVNEKIYTGSYMEFGYWTRDEYGILRYTSISSKLLKPMIEDEDFWNISQMNDWVLFQSLDRIYIYNTIINSFEIFDVESSRAKIFEIDNKIYFQLPGEGFFTIENGKPISISSDLILRNNIIVGAFDFKNKILIITENNEFYLLDGNTLIKWNIQIEERLSSTKLYSTLRLSDGSFILGTISNGLYQLDEDGVFIRHINQANGLNNNTVLSLFQDVDHNLWLGLDNGLSVINLDSPFNEFIDHLGALGVVYTAKLKDDILYLGTNQGLFFKKNNAIDDFQLIKGTEGQVWLLKEIDGTLFCGHHNGTYVVNGDRVLKVSDEAGTWEIQSFIENTELLLQGNYNGLSVLERINGQWKYRNRIEGFDYSSRFFEFVDPRHILVNHDYKGIFDLTLDTEFKKVLEVAQSDSKGTGSSLVRYNDQIIYTTLNGVFKYNRESYNFKKDSVLSDIFFTAEDSIVGILQSTNNSEKLWGFTNNNIVSVSSGLLSDAGQQIKISIPEVFRRSMGVLGFECIVHLKDNLYLIGTSNGYVTLDLNKVKQGENQIYLNSISKEYYDSPKVNTTLKGFNKFEYSENNLHFYFNVPEYDKYTEVYYQYSLNDVYEEWSKWSTVSDVSFENLPYGTYEFKVRAKVGNKLTNNVASFEFVIDRPWFLSYVAIFCYVMFGVFIAVLIHKMYKDYYRRQQYKLMAENKKRLKRKRLKTQKKIVQIKNEQLHELIESKNRELAISTMSIIKKNEFLNSIKNKLKSSSENPSHVKSVIRTIDRNINNEDDWKFFENAFNNADKDFLKKVKDKHPTLSSNDLRLCAYLRLNLSSKEIAPLLNISVRSVEVKRYRLRKKMNLAHEDGLTEYIMGI